MSFRSLCAALMTGGGLALAGAVPAKAQPPEPAGAVRVTAGAVKKYLDEPWEFAFGGSVHVYVRRRLGIGPELLASRGARFHQWSAAGNAVFDLKDPRGRVTPYVTGGAGYLRELDRSIRYRRGELAWNAGVGARVRLGGRLFAAPEFRLDDLAPRVWIGLGYLF